MPCTLQRLEGATRQWTLGYWSQETVAMCWPAGSSERRPQRELPPSAISSAPAPRFLSCMNGGPPMSVAPQFSDQNGASMCVRK